MIEYEIRGNMAVVTGCSKDEKMLLIPTTVEDVPVSKIEPNSFIEMNNLKKVIIPGTVKVIGAYAFAGCKNLEEVVIQEGVEVIENWAFISTGIKKLLIPNSLRTVGENAFLGNEYKEFVNEFMEIKSTHKQHKSHTNNKSCILPLNMLDMKDSITAEMITGYSKYIDDQFDNIEATNDSLVNLDIPFLFDGEEFLIAMHLRKSVENIKVELSNESRMNIGIYSEYDPEYLIVKINVSSGEQILSTLSVKVPYLEAIEFSVIDIVKIEKNGYVYYLIHTKANLSCFGNGNFDRAFALNQYDEVIARYQVQLQNNVIDQEKFDYIMEQFNNKMYSTLMGFLAQVDGAPLMTYIVDVYRQILSDEEYATDEINEYVNNKLFDYYKELGSYKSFENICFNLDESINFIQEATGLTLDQINERYSTAILDAEGNVITIEEANQYKESFIDLDTNYKLHGDFLIYIYKEIQKMINEFNTISYNE